MFRRALSMILAVFLLLALAAGCGETKNNTVTNTPEPSANTPSTPAQEPEDPPSADPEVPEVNEYGD